MQAKTKGSARIMCAWSVQLGQRAGEDRVRGYSSWVCAVAHAVACCMQLHAQQLTAKLLQWPSLKHQAAVLDNT
jgi:hypothetical protein